MKYNTTVQLQCPGNKTNLTWYKEPNTNRISGWKQTQVGNITVLYKSVTLEDEGKYTCKEGNLTIRKWWVHVSTEPGFTEINIECGQEDNACLTCHGNGWYPKPTIEWNIDRKKQIPTGGFTHQNSNGTYHILATVPGLPGRHHYEC